MREDRKQQAQRIRAARDWLDEAGDSLERGADLKGDLKVMLAEAELARAKETERPPLWRRCGRRVLPLATAFAVLSLGLFLQPAVAPPEDQALTVAPPAPAAVSKTQAAEPAAPAALEEMPGQAADTQAAGEPTRAAETKAHTPEPQASPPATVPASPRAILPDRPPSPEKQKLMQSAGKALRAS